ncbi:AAA family ATPase [Roseomonas sp. GC11]|uniref:AAA family ATPase n=1 Tax=Roseomonas sp. GC11 TaxID=2950546 RepID=UPI00210BC378|nr:AAA family ATPase [Roseomonas sp. GC11]MCQ4160824.1 AAA family ATPase [Roseomonas sp. GC11]
MGTSDEIGEGLEREDVETEAANEAVRRRPWLAWTAGEVRARDPLSLWRTLPPSAMWDAFRPVLDEMRLNVANLLARTEVAQPGGVYEAEVTAARLGDAIAWRQCARLARQGAHWSGGDKGPMAHQRAVDLRATCFWMAIAQGDAWSHVPLLSMLADVDYADRPEHYAELLSQIAGDLPDTSDPAAGAIALGLPRLPRTEAKTDCRTADEAPARVTGAEALRAALDDTAPKGTRAKVLVAGDISNLPSHMRRVGEALREPLAIREWPDPECLRERLTAEFPWCADVIARICMDIHLARRIGGKAFRLAPTVFVGAPGAGKSRLALRMAELVAAERGPRFATATGAGMSDNRMLAGTARGWATAEPGWVSRTMSETMCSNPVLLVDELDKIGGGDANGRAQHTLISLTEATTARRFSDEGLGAVIDASRCTWIFTANDRKGIDPVLRARLRFLSVPLPRPQDFPVLIHGICRDLAAEFGGAGPDALPELMPEVAAALERGFRDGRLSARGLAKLVRRAIEGAAEAEAAQPRH